MHLTIDGYGGSPAMLSSEITVREFLDTCPGVIEMTKIADPFVCRYQGVDSEEWGICGLVLIAESHITVHTFPARGLVWADIFSCKAFRPKAAIDALTAAFALQDVKETVLDRGLEQPMPVALEAETLHRPRALRASENLA